MTEITDWLAAFDVDKIWVSARDINGGDEYEWVVRGENVYVTLWIISQPQHNGGECVYLDVANKGLVVEECDQVQYYLCKFYD